MADNICPERVRLAREFSETCKKLSDAIQALSAKIEGASIGGSNVGEAFATSEGLFKAFKEFESARNALREHVQRHKC